ncbi:MAG: MmcQ/YjbR family DNA-binding protein [Bacteroidales bacterium]|nr:MmcQ/YjbR family DNA-binding protein [Bacteroidales bacterium]MDD4209732.1 MmcQ/YjbR family DNA-binding protein [Bacteroidales bacterium]
MMNIEEVRLYCLSKEKTEESFPFDDETLVFKVNNKMYALLSLSGDARLSLKCNPEKAIELREYHPEITPGYHMNKEHWNTVDLKGNLPDSLIKELINHSYTLISNPSKKVKK